MLLFLQSRPVSKKQRSQRKLLLQLPWFVLYYLGSGSGGGDGRSNKQTQCTKNSKVLKQKTVDANSNTNSEYSVQTLDLGNDHHHFFQICFILTLLFVWLLATSSHYCFPFIFSSYFDPIFYSVNFFCCTKQSFLFYFFSDFLFFKYRHN